MGFRTGAYATVWEVNPVSNVNTKGRISISRKDKNTGEYRDEFTGYVSFLGEATAKDALQLKNRDRIRLKDIDVNSKYDKERKTMFHNFNIFSFEHVQSLSSGGGSNSNSYSRSSSAASSGTNPYDGDPIEEDLPF